MTHGLRAAAKRQLATAAAPEARADALAQLAECDRIRDAVLPALGYSLADAGGDAGVLRRAGGGLV